jgi:hypothetical protein
MALALLPGCAWMHGNRNAKRDQPAAVEPDSPGMAQVAREQSSNAKVGLDGSAASDGAPQTPNAPGIAATAQQKAATDDDLTLDAPSGKQAQAGAASAFADDDEEQPHGVVPATASGSGVNTVATADALKESESAKGSKKDESLTNLPGSFDVVGDGVKVEQGVVAATVNGQPIFVEDVLRDVPREYIRQHELQLDPKQFKTFRKQLIEAHLQRPIEEELLLQALKTKLKPDQLKDISKQIDKMFDKEYLPAAMKQAGFETEPEFEKALREKGSSIELLRTKNRNRELAQQYIGAKVMPKSGFDLPDQRKYYKEHKADYAIVAQAKWDQIYLKFSKNGGPDKTRKKAEEIAKRLTAGEDFAAIARESSNGPNASKGGARGWTTRGSLANDALNVALFEQSLGEIGPVIESKDGIDIIRVVDRQEATYKPFSAVQEDIKAQLKNDEWTKSSRALFQDLMEKATIVKMTENL